MVKIPATVEGLPAIQQMIAEGRNINVTLIFSLDRYQAVMEAYLAGLEAFAADPDADLSQVASVASFFISRVDTEVDRRLDAIGTDEALALRGKAAVAQGKLAYRLFLDTFSGPRWEALAAAAPGCSARCGPARHQEPGLLRRALRRRADRPDTVNTLPEATLEAFADHGTLARTVDADVDEADRVWARARRRRRRHGRRRAPSSNVRASTRS
jgi:transaldolase